ncbi:hypothetical protein QL285_012579 [Trifolium repens]|nr:hypothetical protein QL285_012579 [Trifolium repens]
MHLSSLIFLLIHFSPSISFHPSISSTSLNPSISLPCLSIHFSPSISLLKSLFIHPYLHKPLSANFFSFISLHPSISLDFSSYSFLHRFLSLRD